jgi:hypothetical protein
MCGVEMSGNKSKRTDELCAVKPLEDNVAFEIVEGNEVWHPMWKGYIDDKVNALFVKTVIQRIWQNEKVSTCLSMRGEEVLTPSTCQSQRAGGKSEIADTDFMMPAITSCVKNYWHNVHKQWRQQVNPEKHQKTLDNTKYRSRHSNVRLPTVLCSDVMMLI